MFFCLLVFLLFPSWQWERRFGSRFAPSQRETALLCNDVSHWLGANLESALRVCMKSRIVSHACVTQPWNGCIPSTWHIFFRVSWDGSDFVCLGHVIRVEGVAKFYFNRKYREISFAHDIRLICPIVLIFVHGARHYHSYMATYQGPTISITFNSVKPSDAYMRHQPKPSLVQIMACRLLVPSHYLNPWRNIVTWTFRNKL